MKDAHELLPGCINIHFYHLIIGFCSQILSNLLQPIIHHMLSIDIPAITAATLSEYQNFNVNIIMLACYSWNEIREHIEHIIYIYIYVLQTLCKPQIVEQHTTFLTVESLRKEAISQFKSIYFLFYFFMFVKCIMFVHIVFRESSCFPLSFFPFYWQLILNLQCCHFLHVNQYF